MHDFRLTYSVRQAVSAEDKLLALLNRLSIDVGSGEIHGISHVNSFALYIWKIYEVELMSKAGDYFIKYPTKVTIFHLASFYNAAMTSLAELRNDYAQYEVSTQPSFQLSTSVRLKGQAGSSGSVK